MKKLIKGLYIAFFPEQYEAERNRVIDDLKSRLRATENMLLASEGMAGIRISREAIYQFTVALNQLREAEDKNRKEWAQTLGRFQRSNLNKTKTYE